ncbi:MAG: TonB-dependent receptor [Rikenellaceae bacterium]|nr:TonB-dependent receptor [Rikenellaceae bacterium]
MRIFTNVIEKCRLAQVMLVFAALVCVNTVYAQQVIKGNIASSNGEAIIGASVIVEGTTTGTTTDLDGNFQLEAPAKSSIVVSYLGYQTQTLAATTAFMKVVMVEDNALLDEVVVVGYGTMKRSDLTGSTTQVKSEAITSVMAANPLEALQGKSTGVAVFTNNQPGEAPTLRIRGSASINAGTDPLYVVDGFPLTDANMNDFNPADIESMEILKDASATAIYGSRGANGVVMITTKKGSEGRHNISFHANMGIQMRSRLLETITGDEFIEYINTATVNQGGSKPFPNGYNGKFYDWQKEIIQKSAISQDYGVSLDGMAKDTKYMFSAGYYNQDGLIESQGYEKFSVHSNLEHDFNKYFTIGANMQFTTATQRIQTDPITNDIFRYGWPTDHLINEDGSFNIVQHGEAFNPLADIAATNDKVKSARFVGNFFAQVNFTDHFNYRLNIGYDTKTANRYQFLSSQTAKGIQAGSTTSKGMHNWNRQESRLMDNIFTYSNQWGDHRMSLTGVYSWQDYKFNTSRIEGNFSNDALGAWDFAGADQASLKATSDIYSNRLISWTARGTYAFKDKYLLTATVRFDGSSRFGADSKWGTFPSVGLAWRASEENFLKDSNVITNLKIRGSYGVTGNQEIGNYQSLARLATKDGDSNYSDGVNNVQGFYESVGNSKLQWEKTTQVDLGFDLTMWDLLHVNFDYYNRQTSDLLYTVPIPSTSGYSSVLSNVGEVSNQGIELAVSADVYRSKDWTITVGGNFTYNTNEIKKLYDGADRITVYDGSGTTGLSRVLEVGQPVNGVFGFRSLGIIKNEQQLADYIEAMPKLAGTVGVGSEMYADVDGDGGLSINDAECIGSVEPSFFYGFNLGVQWKQLKLNIYGQGAWDYASMAGSEDYYNNGSKWAIAYQNTGNYALWANNTVRNQIGLPTKDGYRDMWSPSNPNGKAPMAGAKGILLSDRTNADWAYFILKNIQLSYDFSDLINTKYIKGLVFNVNFQNFGTWANHIGYNPENGDVSNPYAKLIMCGVNIKF